MKKPKARKVEKLYFDDLIEESKAGGKEEKATEEDSKQKEKTKEAVAKAEESSKKEDKEKIAELEKTMDTILTEDVATAEKPQVLARVAKIEKKLNKSHANKKTKEEYKELLDSAKTLDEVAKVEKEMKEKLEISEVVKHATKIMGKIDASSLSDAEKGSLENLVTEVANIEDLKKVERNIESQLFTFKGDKIEFSNKKLTLGHIFPSESEKSVILIDGKPAFLNPELKIDEKAQYCYATMEGEYGERAKVYSGKTKVKVLTEQESAGYFEHGKPRPVKIAEAELKQLKKTPEKIKTEKVDIDVKKEETLVKDLSGVATLTANTHKEDQ